MKYLIRYVVAFAIFSIITTTSRALINIDYCLVGLCSPFIGRYWAAALYSFYEILETQIPRSANGDEKFSCRRQVQAFPFVPIRQSEGLAVPLIVFEAPPLWAG